MKGPSGEIASSKTLTIAMVVQYKERNLTSHIALEKDELWQRYI